MNRLVLDDLQRRRAYPSVTLLLNTEPGPRLAEPDQGSIHRLVEQVDHRLAGDAPDDVRARLVADLTALAEQIRREPASAALALCVSPEHAAAAPGPGR
jgi:hypothetical protein